jgi:small subunit ribosomal protein S8
MTDPIGDFFIRIKNGYLAGKRQVLVPYSKIKEQLAKILVEEGYLKKCQISNVKSQMSNKNLELELKYEGRKPVLTDVKRISKPGLRIYAKAKKIPKVRSGFGITIVSTPQGLMTDTQAGKKNLGGEIICQIW